MDSQRPIDVLFYGGSNSHRLEIKKQFKRLEDDHNYRVVFVMSYNLFGAQKEELIRQSKVVLLKQL